MKFTAGMAMLGRMKWLMAALLLPFAGLAQTDAGLKLTLTSPADFQVFQRKTAAGGGVVIEGGWDAPGHAALTNLEQLEGLADQRKPVKRLDPPGVRQSHPPFSRGTGGPVRRLVPAGTAAGRRGSHPALGCG